MKQQYQDWTFDLSELDSKYRELYTRAIEDMWQVVNSQHFLDAFKEVVQGYAKYLEGELGKYRHDSPEEIVQMIREACKQVHVRAYWTNANVIGYGLPSDDITRVNTRYLAGERADVAKDRMERGKNLVHEKAHDGGAHHDFNATARRDNSIAYLAGKAYEITYWRCFPDEATTVVKTPSAKVYKKKPWWRIW